MAPREIHLLDLEPGATNDPIKLQIETTALDNAKGYACLSYAWGPPHPQRAITLNGCTFPIRENLYLAFRRLRLSNKARRLWVDAVCINQGDITEREAQVGIMQYVFNAATDVIAWIGEDNGASDKRAIHLMRKISARSLELIENHLSKEDRSRGIALRENLADWLEAITPFGLVDSIWVNFTSLIDRSWFSRIWIIQEVVMGKEVTVQCGPHKFDWTELFYCAILITDHADLIRSLAAPECPKYHDPEKRRFCMESQPLYRLLKASESIRSIGHLASQWRMHRLVRDIAEPKIKEYLNCHQSEDDGSAQLWGLMSPDLRSLCIYATCPPTPSLESSPPPPINLASAVADRNFITHLVSTSPYTRRASSPSSSPPSRPRSIPPWPPTHPNIGRILSYFNSIPIYSTTMSRADTLTDPTCKN
ncbi:hypothetical protein VTI74DRAFT_6662 [Chaetomium olivicolor]